MTPEHQRSSTRANPFILAALGAVLICAFYVNIHARDIPAQEVFGVETDFDDV